MRFLWTISNWKHTGPVEPSLDLARGVVDAGHEVLVEVGRPPPWEGAEAGELRALRDLPPAGIGARLHKHAFLGRDLPDAWRLRGWIRKRDPDVLVATLPNDHRLLLRARRRTGRRRPVARLWFADGRGGIASREQRALLAADRVFAFGDEAVERLGELGLPPDRVRQIGPPLDVARLRARVGDVAAARRSLGVPESEFLFGIVARLQVHRRYEMLWEAVDALRRAGPAFRLVVLGRGSRAEEVGRAPVRARRLEDHVHFAGYLRGTDYASAVASFDAQLLLVPGSDPTCRALREGMALGVPSLATRRGLLPSIVEDGRTGLLVDETPDALADAMRRLASDREAARQMGRAARLRADERFATPRVAAAFLRGLEGV